MLTIDQLNQIRERVGKELQVRHPHSRLLISVGTVGLAAGARQVMVAALDEISRLGLQLVVAGEDSQALPEQLPSVRVVMPAEADKVYTRVSPEMVRQIVRELAPAPGGAAERRETRVRVS